MTITDRVYGKISITEPVILALLASAPMQRLRGINQYGAHVFIHPNRNVTRYEHSIGVWYLLKLFKASPLEQIAGLLHDVPHTAFSHTVDYLLGTAKHDFHDHFTESMLINSEIPGILTGHGIDIHAVVHGDFPLLRANLPELSADRIDYFFRDTRPDQLFPDTYISHFLSDLIVRKQKFVFTSQGLASSYALLFATANRLLWTDPTSMGSFALMAEILKLSLESGVITQADFWQTDAIVMQKIQTAADPKVLQLLARLRPGTEFDYCPESEAEFSGRLKSRIVDPSVLHKGRILPVSTLIPRLQEYFSDLHHKAVVTYIRPRLSSTVASPNRPAKDIHPNRHPDVL